MYEDKRRNNLLSDSLSLGLGVGSVALGHKGIKNISRGKKLRSSALEDLFYSKNSLRDAAQDYRGIIKSLKKYTQDAKMHPELRPAEVRKDLLNTIFLNRRLVKYRLKASKAGIEMNNELLKKEAPKALRRGKIMLGIGGSGLALALGSKLLSNRNKSKKGG